jgi:Calcineurin-like phosphoesterase superfamily domain
VDLFEDKPARTFERIAALADGDVLVFGHTHKPWVHEYGGVLFANCGSVGKPKNGGLRASFAVFPASGSGVDVVIERVAYNAEQLLRRCMRSACPTSWPRSCRLPRDGGMRPVSATRPLEPWASSRASWDKVSF